MNNKEKPLYMATKKTASKTSARASLNFPSVSTPSVKKRTVKKSAKTAEKQLKKMGAKGIVAALVCLIIGIGVGLAAYFSVCKNDCFEIVGGDEITITLDQKYIEQGVKIIEFGKDISGNAKIESDLELTDDGLPMELGTFYVKYTVDSVKYGKIFKIQKVRLISVVETSEGGE